MSEIPPAMPVGRRVVVTGMAGAGKSTFSRALSAKTGLPVIHLDVHFWNPGWVAPPEDEWREKQRVLLTSDEWIVDGNYHANARPSARARRHRRVPRHAVVDLCTACALARHSQASGWLRVARWLRRFRLATVARRMGVGLAHLASPAR
jgi:hypothetical protein